MVTAIFSQTGFFFAQIANYSVSIRISAMIQINREIGHPVVGPRRALEVGGCAPAQPIQRNHILADRMTGSVEILDFDLERARVVAGIADLAFDRYLVAAPYQPRVGDLDRFRAGQQIEYVDREA